MEKWYDLRTYDKAEKKAALIGAGAMFATFITGAAMCDVFRALDEQLPSGKPSIEMTCDQLSKQDTSIRGLDGTVYMLKCDANGNPAIPESQERR